MRTIIVKNLSTVADETAAHIAGTHLKTQKDATFGTLYDYLLDCASVNVKVSENEASGKITYVITDKEEK